MTVLGVGVGVAVAVLTRDRTSEPARQAGRATHQASDVARGGPFIGPRRLGVSGR